MVLESRRPDVIVEAKGICTPFIDGDTLYYGFHSGKDIMALDLKTLEEPTSVLSLKDCPMCKGHISSPAVYGNEMVFHGPSSSQRGQFSFRAFFMDGEWRPDPMIIGPPYMRRMGNKWLAKKRGIAVLADNEFIGVTLDRTYGGPYRHAHYFDDWLYYSQWGEEEYIMRMRLGGGEPEIVYRPDIPYRRTKSGPAKHRMEVRDPFINLEYFACVCEGEREIRIWRF